MKNIRILFLLVTGFLATHSAVKAETETLDRVYMNSWANAYDSKWENRNWRPSDWIGQEQSAQDVINGFYQSGIITDQYFNNNVPVLEVGYPFLQLSGRDQRRVTNFVAAAFNVNSRSEFKAMHIVLKSDDVPLGIYTRGQLQLH